MQKFERLVWANKRPKAYRYSVFHVYTMFLYITIVNVFLMGALLGLENHVAICQFFHDTPKIDTFGSQLQAKEDLPPNIRPWQACRASYN